MSARSQYPSLPNTPPVNFHHALFRNELDDHILHVDSATGLSRTRSDFMERVKLAATALTAPIDQGGLALLQHDSNFVLIICRNSMDYIVLFHALIYLAIPFAMVLASSSVVELEHMIKQAPVTNIFASPDILPRALAVAERFGLGKEVFHVVDGSVDGYSNLSSLITQTQANSVAEVKVQPVQQDTIAYIIFSSGTSGTPKPVIITHANLVATLLQVRIKEGHLVQNEPEVKSVAPVLKWLHFLPFPRAFACNMIMTSGFLVRATHIIMPEYDDRIAINAIAKYNINLIGVSPGHLLNMVTSPYYKNADLSSLKTLLVGGAYLPPSTIAQVGPEIYISQGYGLSEATLGAIGTPKPGILPANPPMNGGTGILWPGMEAKIIRPDGSNADFEEVGELLLKGPNIASGYYMHPEATQEVFQDGWLRTGDQFKIDKNHVFHFLDRSKDIMKSPSGGQISPIELETMLLSQPDQFIVDAVVTGVNLHRSQTFERVPRAWVVLSELGKAVNEEEVIRKLDEWIKQNLISEKWIIGGYAIVQEIPKNTLKKPLRYLLQEGFEKIAI
ncbi:hypothetical protein F5051DRAFT_356760 [Lentinula edodes]|nr:hypothetical protein F5051DRAFT_356760 [Lentinula edodes]